MTLGMGKAGETVDAPPADRLKITEASIRSERWPAAIDAPVFHNGSNRATITPGGSLSERRRKPRPKSKPRGGTEA